MAITSRTGSRGGALLAVLWLSAAMAAIAFSLANTVRGEAERASTATDSTRDYYLASAALRRTTLRMLWTRLNPAISPQFQPFSPSLDVLQFPEGEARVEIISENSKLNINYAPPEQLFRLLINLGVEPGRAREITMGIVDWRGVAPSNGLGEFDQYYLSRTPSFRALHASFEEIEDLLLVKGMTPDIYYGTYERRQAKAGAPAPLVARGGLADCVSVYGAMGPHDVNTTQPAVLGAIGVTPDVIAALVERRRVAPFRNDGELNGFLEGNPALAHLRVGGYSIFLLRATARIRLANGQLSDLRRSVAATIKFMMLGYDPPYQVLRWYDMAWGQRP